MTKYDQLVKYDQLRVINAKLYQIYVDSGKYRVSRAKYGQWYFGAK